MLIQDCQYAMRQLRRSPGFTLTALITLALTVGLAATVFSVFDALLIRPLPYGQPNRIVALEPRAASGYTQPASWPDYTFWRQNNRCFQVLAGFSSQTMNMRGPQGPAAIHAVHATDNFFAALQVRPLLGRTFLPSENVQGRTDVAVLSYSLWSKAFGASRDVIGRAIELDGRPMIVIGVMPKSFHFPLQWSEVAYAPFRASAEELQRDDHWMQTLARLKPGVSIPAAEADMNRVLAAYATVHPDSKGRRMQLLTLPEQVLGQTRGLLGGLVLAVLAILSLGCVNIAGLMLVRGLRRERELVLRAALGATHAQLTRQVYTEIVLLAVGGTVLATGFAYALLHSIHTLLLAALQRGSEVSLNAPALLASLAAALVTLLVAGLVPARQIAVTSPARVLRSGTSGAGGSRVHSRLGTAFIAAQMALAMLLLTASGLLLRSLTNLCNTDLGFRSDHLLLEDVNLSPGTIKGRDLLTTFYDPLLRQVRALPGVESAGIINMLPVQDYGFNSEVQIVGKPPAPRNRETLAELRFLTPGYYRATGIHLLRGRLLDAKLDTRTSQPVIVVNAAFVKKFFEPGEDPIGQHIVDENHAMIVGVVSNQRQSLFEPPLAEMDYSVAQLPADNSAYLQEMQLVIHTKVAPLTLARPLQGIMQRLDPGLPFRPPETEQGIIWEVLMMARMENWLFGTFAALAVLLAMVGLYGLVAQRVELSRRDIGVHMALGAQRWQVLVTILRQVAAVSVSGLFVGLLLAYSLRRVITSVLDVRFNNKAWFLILLVVGMEAVALLSCIVPARRAASVDPVEALRAE